MRTCLYCRYAVQIGKPGTPGENDGVCHRRPPQFMPPSSASFLPIHIATFWCGDFKPRRTSWWQFWRPRRG